MPLVRLLRNDAVPDETEIEQLLRRGVKLGSIEAAIELARVLDEAGQWPEARLILKTAVAFEGEQFWRKNKSFDAAFALGTRLEAHYEKAEAQDAFRVAVERGSVAAQTRLVRLFVRTDDSAAAEKFAVEKGWLTNLAPGLILARYLCRAGRTDAVLSLLRSLAVCAHELEDASSLEKIARIFEACGQVEDAERIYEQAAQLGSTQSAHELARLLNVKGQPERAQRALSVAEIISNDILPAKDTRGGRV
jgi:tetratricopeptide (TPR) repeat protein